MLLSPVEAGDIARERLTADHFYHVRHQVIFTEICALMDALKAVDNVTLMQRLQDKGQLEEVGGAAYLADLIARVPTTANIEHYLDIVTDKALLRRAIAFCHETSVAAYAAPEDAAAWLAEREAAFLALNRSSAAAIVPVAQLVIETIQEFDAMHRTGGLLGLSTGFRDLDQLTGGLQPQQFVVLAARPSHGKTALAMNVAEHVAVDQQQPTLVFSIEMSAKELMQRLFCARAAVNIRAIREGFTTDSDWIALTKAAAEIKAAPLFIDETGAIDIAVLCARARRLARQHAIKLIVVDYIQQIRCAKIREHDERLIVSEASRALKALAKELRIPVLACAQLARRADDRERPKLSDLKESGQLEQDADIVAFIRRPELQEDDPDAREEKRGQAELIIEKQRNGPIGLIPLVFDAAHTRFRDAARDTEP
jgi:replicative DNA helicase